MSYTSSIHGQVQTEINRLKFESLVQDTQNDKYVKSITSWGEGWHHPLAPSPKEKGNKSEGMKTKDFQALLISIPKSIMDDVVVV